MVVYYGVIYTYMCIYIYIYVFVIEHNITACAISFMMHLGERGPRVALSRRLRIAPLFHSIDPGGTTWKIRSSEHGKRVFRGISNKRFHPEAFQPPPAGSTLSLLPPSSGRAASW